MRKYLLLFSCLLILTCAMAACQSPNPKAKGTKRLVFWTMQLADFKTTLEPMFAEYEAKHPGIQIKWIDVPGNEIEKRALTAAMSDNVPDVVNLNPDFSAILASRGVLINMARALTPKQQSVYLPVAWQAATLSRESGVIASSTRDMTFGLPWYITSRVTLYNKALLKQAGYQHPPKNYPELMNFSKTVHQKTGQYALMPILSQSGNFLKELLKLDIPLYDAKGRAVFATPLAVSHLTQYVNQYQQGIIPAEALSEDHRAAVDRYQSGSLALLLVGPNFLNIIQENAPQIYQQTEVSPQFPEESPYVDFSEMVLVVPQKSKFPTEAVEFARFITNADNQLKLAQAAPVLPSVTSALRSGEFQMANAADVSLRAKYASAQQLLNAKMAYQIRPQQNEINELINYHVQLALLGKMSPKAALLSAQEKINALNVRK